MPLYEYRCREGHTEEHISPVGADSHRCSCGAEAKRVWSTFALKSYRHDRSDWELVAPLNAEGKPMTMVEAARSGLIDRYSPDEQARARRHERDQEGRLRSDRAAEAKRDAWKEISRRNKIEVR